MSMNRIAPSFRFRRPVAPRISMSEQAGRSRHDAAGFALARPDWADRPEGATMIRLSVLYPAGEGATFDHDYYRESHVPLCLRTWNLDSAEIDRGLDGPYVAAVHLHFDSLDHVAEAMAAEGTA